MLGHIFPVEEGLAAVLDTDSHFHHSAAARGRQNPRGEVIETPALPQQCSVEVEEKDGGFFWNVVELETGETVCTVPEEDIRWSVSCKFHIFSGEKEAARYKDEANGLTTEHLIREMQKDLFQKGKIPEDWAKEHFPLYLLGAAFFKHYIEPRAPKTEDIKKAWSGII